MALATAVTMLAAPIATAGDTPPRGQSSEHSYSSGAFNGTYRTYIPATLAAAKGPVPLLVVLHGMGETASEQEQSSLLDRLADREKFVLMYPDTGETGPELMWDFGLAERGTGDSALIVGEVGEVEKMAHIDRQRVFVMGMSMGGMMTSVLAASYPDVFAASGLMAGIAYKDMTCTFTGVALRPEVLSEEAYLAMGVRKRVMPVLVIGGDQDTAVYPSCQDNARQQWLMTNGKVLGTTLGSASKTRTVPKAGGYTSTETSYTDAQGCLILEQWRVHGMKHFWSGGSADPHYAKFTDPKGPSAGELAWKFFSRYRLSDTAPPCTESRGTPAGHRTVGRR